jgi:hypothetical protein
MQGREGQLIAPCLLCTSSVDGNTHGKQDGTTSHLRVV